MRMWTVDPAYMCRKHLLGEHVELHMFVGAIEHGKSIEGYLEKGLLNPIDLARRHGEITREMSRRGYRHSSPLSLDNIPTTVLQRSRILPDSTSELLRRCERCRLRRDFLLMASKPGVDDDPVLGELLRMFESLPVREIQPAALYIKERIDRVPYIDVPNEALRAARDYQANYANG